MAYTKPISIEGLKVFKEEYTKNNPSVHVWQGTREEYEEEKNTIPNDSLIILTDSAQADLTIDTELSLSSDNPVQNKVITEHINSLSTGKQDKLTAGTGIILSEDGTISVNFESAEGVSF